MEGSSLEVSRNELCRLLCPGIRIIQGETGLNWFMTWFFENSSKTPKNVSSPENSSNLNKHVWQFLPDYFLTLIIYISGKALPHPTPQYSFSGSNFYLLNYLAIYKRKANWDIRKYFLYTLLYDIFPLNSVHLGKKCKRSGHLKFKIYSNLIGIGGTFNFWQVIPQPIVHYEHAKAQLPPKPHSLVISAFSTNNFPSSLLLTLLSLHTSSVAGTLPYPITSPNQTKPQLKCHVGMSSSLKH